MVSWETLQIEVDFILQWDELCSYHLMPLSQDGLQVLLIFSRLQEWSKYVTVTTKNH